MQHCCRENIIMWWQRLHSFHPSVSLAHAWPGHISRDAVLEQKNFNLLSTTACSVGCIIWQNVSILLQKTLAFAPRVTMIPKKLISKIINHLRIAFKVWGWRVLQYKTEKLTSPIMTIPFDYNLIFLLVEHAYVVCPTTFMMKISRFRGTSVYWPWS